MKHVQHKSIISFLLTGIITVTALGGVACAKTGNGNLITTDNPLFEGMESVCPIPASEYNLVEDGTSNYRIVIPVGCDENVIYAASELQNLIELSSGVKLSIEEDGEDFNENTMVISLGDTTVYRQALSQDASLEITEDLKYTGYVMKRMDKTLIINAKEGTGVYPAVYDMLGYTIGLEYYSYDEVAYREMNTIPLLDFNEKFIPSVDIRTVSVSNINSNYSRKMKNYTALGTGLWATFAHTTVSVYLPVEKYMASCPEYYGNTNGRQVCYANAEMRAEMVEAMKRYISSYTEAKYIMIGHEDNADMCTCDACIDERAHYGNYAGQELHFANLIAEELNEWMAINYPNRQMEYVFFAYMTTQEPPVKTEVVNGKAVPVYDENGNYLPFNDDFEIVDNVRVFYAPIDADFSKPITEESNVTHYEQLRGWRDLFNYAGHEGESNIIVWSYGTSFHNYYVPLNNIGAYKQQYEFYANMGAGYVFDQGNSTSGIFSFESLRIYTQSKLMYDTSADYNKLAADFIQHYYGEGAEDISRLYNFIRTYYEYLEEVKGLNGTIYYEHGEDPTFWPMEVIDTMMKYCDAALEKIQPLKESDPSRFTTLNNRIRRERLMPIFLMFKHYINEVPLDKREEYYNDMVTYTRMFNITETYERGMDMENNLDLWKIQLFG